MTERETDPVIHIPIKLRHHWTVHNNLLKEKVCYQ